MLGVTAGAPIPEYAVIKHAVVALSEALQAQLAARQARVGVTVLCPGGSRRHRRRARRPFLRVHVSESGRLA
jgi:NAD(P)-dependent dehydrogenase (short-subunit alcohol dehydrogenase family)